jgi:group I intron endonuclease
MKKMKIAGIYKIVSPSGAVYIGQSLNIRKRWASHRGDYKKRPRFRIASSMAKYGPDRHKFSIEYHAPLDIDRTILDNIEQLFISQYKEGGAELMNLTEGGTGGRMFTHPGHSAETKAKIGDANRGKVHDPAIVKTIADKRRGQKISLEHAKKLKASRLGKPHTEESKAKMRVATKEGLKAAFANGFKRGPLSEATKKKISEANKGGTGRASGYKHSEETKAKIGLANSKK